MNEKSLKQKYFTIVNEVGSIQRNATNPGARGARYATLSNVIQHLQPLLEQEKCFIKFDFTGFENDVYKCNLSLNDVESDAEMMWAFDIPIDNRQSNRVQAFGSTTTYGQRYALCVAFQIALDDTDPDAQQPHSLPQRVEAKAITAAKPIIAPGTPNWDKALAYLVAGGEWSAIAKSYQITAEHMAALEAEVETQKEEKS